MEQGSCPLWLHPWGHLRSICSWQKEGKYVMGTFEVLSHLLALLLGALATAYYKKSRELPLSDTPRNTKQILSAQPAKLGGFP